MRKSIFILSAMLLFLSFSALASDNNDCIALITDESACVDSEIEVMVNYNTVNGCSVFQFDLEFDTAVLKLKSMDTTGSALGGELEVINIDVANSSGTVPFVYVNQDLQNISFNGKLAVLTFEVLPDTEVGEAAFNTSVVAAARYNEREIENIAVNTDYATVKLLRQFERVSMPSATYTYDGYIKSLSVVGAEEYGVTPRYSGNVQVSTGTYDVTAVLEKEGYETKTLTATLKIEPATLTLSSIHPDAKLCVLSGFIDGEGDGIDIDYSQLIIKKRGDDWVASNFILTGEDSVNYTLKTRSIVFSPDKDSIVTVNVESENGLDVYEFYRGQSASVTAPRISGYDFEGWYDEYGDKLSDERTYEFIAADCYLLAKYLSKEAAKSSKKEATVKFDTCGAETIRSQTVEIGETAKIPDTPIKSGYIFAGWYTDADYTDEFDFTKAIAKDITLYARWLEDNRIIMTVGSKEAYVFGNTVTNDVAPVIYNDRAMFPARFIAENLDATVSWDSEARKVTITGITIELAIGSDIAYVNGNAVKLDSPAIILDGRTYTPVRFIAESLGANVAWDNETKNVTLTK